jgi:hypothetical protein
MKVSIGKESYLVHFQKRQKESNVELAGPVKILTTITCVIRDGSDKEEICTGRVVQNYEDSGNCVLGRKAALALALAKAEFDRKERVVFWDEYKSKCRLTKNSYRAQNKKLKEKIVELEAEIKEVRETMAPPAMG